MIETQSVPSFRNLSDQYAVILRGRSVGGDPTGGWLREVDEAVATLRDQHGIPLALITTQGFDEVGDADTVFCRAFIGRVLHCRREGDAPAELAADSIDGEGVPEEIWNELKELVTDKDDADALWLVATGWSQALLMSGELEQEEDWEPDDGPWEGDVDGDEIAVVSSEDTDPAATLDEERLAAVRHAGSAFLWCVYI